MEPDAGTAVQSKVALRSAELQKAIAEFANPALRESLQRMIADLGDPGNEPASVKKEFNEAKRTTNQAFDVAQKVSAAEIKQDILQSGARGFNPRVTEAITSRASRNIEGGRTQALGSLDFEEASAGLGQTNYLLTSMLKAGATAGQGAFGYGSNAMGAGQILSAQSAQSRQQGSTYGAIAGTILGALLSPYTGGMSIPIGSALGGAAGGYLSG